VLDTFFSGEAWFHLRGYVNSRKSRLWISESPLPYHETPLHPMKIRVWRTVSWRRVFGPVLLEETFNAEVITTP
jgi:hypothetical protein